MTQKSNKKVKLPEFIFGNLSTAAGRLQQARLNRVGFYHDCNLIPSDPLPNQTITITVKVGADIALKQAQLYYTTDGTLPNTNSQVLALTRTNLVWDTLDWSYLEEWTATIPPQEEGTFIQYIIQGMTTANYTIKCPYFDINSTSFDPNNDNFYSEFIKKNPPPELPQVYGFYIDNEITPSWFKEAIIYQIFIDRFAGDPGQELPKQKDLSEIYGGTLKGIISKLEYLQELGINCIWLTPLFPTSSHHGYDATDYSTIEPRLGTMADFQELINQAHSRGIKVILDYVANHFSKEHPAFIAAQKDQSSPSYNWFSFIEWPTKYQAFYDLPSLPKINSDNQEARNYLITHAQGWLELGVDGFRLDHAHGVTHAFWSAFRHETRRTKADSITFGEITEPSDLVRSYSGRMDGVLDFELLELLREFFAFETLKVSEFEKKINQHYAYFGANLVMPSFLDNHDMNRFLWLVEGDKRRLRLAALCQFTLPNPPIIYYGTEVGLTQRKNVGRLEESRLPMVWDDAQDQDLLKFYQQLIKLRSTANFSQLPLQTILVDDLQKVFIYSRGKYTIVLHNALKKQTFTLRTEIKGGLLFTTTGNLVYDSATAQLHLPEFSGCIFG